MPCNSIGLFDSGLGGLSIWKEISSLLPKESTVYIADNGNMPYGQKDKTTIINLSKANASRLITEGCKLIVVACNTATTNAISLLRNNFDVPFVGVEPAIKPAFLNTKSGVVGVLVTQGTLTSELFSKTMSLHSNDIHVIKRIGHGLVEMVENPKTKKSDLRSLLRKYLDPMVSQGIDHLVLGCTHYYFLKPIMSDILPKHVKIIDSGKAVALQTQRILKQHNLLTDSASAPQHQFHSTGDPTILKYFVKKKL